MLLDLLRLSRAVGEASSGKLSGKLNLNITKNRAGLTSAIRKLPYLSINQRVN